jgi:hypothetical protein
VATEERIAIQQAIATIRNWITAGRELRVTVEVAGIVLVSVGGRLNAPINWEPDDEDLIIEALGLSDGSDELDFRGSFHALDDETWGSVRAATFGEGVVLHHRPAKSRLKRALRLAPKVRVLVTPS